MVPALTVPPLPHFCLRVLATCFNAASSTGMPVITVTPLPLRPLVALPTLTMPSPAGCTGVFLQLQRSSCLWHDGQVRPCSVEYTRRAFRFSYRAISILSTGLAGGSEANLATQRLLLSPSGFAVHAPPLGTTGGAGGFTFLDRYQTAADQLHQTHQRRVPVFLQGSILLGLDHDNAVFGNATPAP